MENITAISTAIGVGGVAIIRISGNSPLDIAKKMFEPSGKTKVADFEPYKLYPGEIDGGQFTDFGMCVYFKAPKSYTGEDMIELHCHGGLAITKGILQMTLKYGARLATNGEFSKRAFLNGKMSLSSCEGLIDMINSQSLGEVKAGYYLYREKLTKIISQQQAVLTTLLAKINANIDYPEEGLEDYELDEIKSQLVNIKDNITTIISRYKTGRKITHGVKVAIIGKPNTGKSSILNSLISYDKAIVSNIPGTTRDVVDSEIVINGIKFCLYDTAGIHESQNEIEKIGIERSKKMLDECDIAIFVLNAELPTDDIDNEIYSTIALKNKIIIYNKLDNTNNKYDYDYDLLISAKNYTNIEQLKQLLFDKVFEHGIDLSGDLLTEERHAHCLQRALDCTQTALNNIDCLPLDLIALDIKNTWDLLGEISGDTANEDIITEIFKKFCVGK